MHAGPARGGQAKPALKKRTAPRSSTRQAGGHWFEPSSAHEVPVDQNFLRVAFLTSLRRWRAAPSGAHVPRAFVIFVLAAFAVWMSATRLAAACLAADALWVRAAATIPVRSLSTRDAAPATVL